MRRHLAAIDRARLAQRGLEEGMPRARRDRPAARARDDILRVPHDARVVHDRGARLAPEKRLGQQAHDIGHLLSLTAGSQSPCSKLPGPHVHLQKLRQIRFLDGIMSL